MWYMVTVRKCGACNWDTCRPVGEPCEWCGKTIGGKRAARPSDPTPPPVPVFPPAALRYIAPVWVFDIRRNVRRSSGCNVFILMPQHDYCDGAAPRPSPLEAAA